MYFVFPAFVISPQGILEVGPIVQCCVTQFHAVDQLPFFMCLCNSSYVNACNTGRNFGIGNEVGKFMVRLPRPLILPFHFELP